MKQITRHVSGDAGCMYACSRAAARTDPVLRGRARPKLVNSKTGTLPVPAVVTRGHYRLKVGPPRTRVRRLDEGEGQPGRLLGPS